MYDIARLESFDTPTICNALESIDPERRRFGFTSESLYCLNEEVGPRAGIACTATMRSLDASEFDADELRRERINYYAYMSEPAGVPKICVMQDLDGVGAGRGPFFGEFNVRIHRALGFRAIVTDGAMRDRTKLPDDILLLSCGLRPSHGFVHIVDWARQVNVYGMYVKHGSLVHADIHGAVTFPVEIAEQVERCAIEFVASEAPIMEACKQDRLTLDELTRLYMARVGDPFASEMAGERPSELDDGA